MSQKTSSNNNNGHEIKRDDHIEDYHFGVPDNGISKTPTVHNHFLKKDLTCPIDRPDDFVEIL